MLNIKLAALAFTGLLALGGIGLTAQETQAAVASDMPAAPGHFRGFEGPLIPLVNPGERDAAIAGALGIPIEELEASREDGVRLPELAEELNVDMAEVLDALQETLIAEVEEAVVEGDMTQERADRILERIEVTNVMRDYFGMEARLEVLADALGLTPDDLLAAREDGVPMKDLLAEAAVEPLDVREAMEAAREEAINQALDDGALTAEQAEQLLEGPGRFIPRALRERLRRFGPAVGPQGAAPLSPSAYNG